MQLMINVRKLLKRAASFIFGQKTFDKAQTIGHTYHGINIMGGG